MAQMATVYRLKTVPPAIVGFLTDKLKTPLIQELVQYYSTPLPEDHGVASCIRHEEVKKLAQQMATHTFCCFVKIGASTLRSTAVATDRFLEQEKKGVAGAAPPLGEEEGEGLAPWVVSSDRAEVFLNTLSYLWGWLEVETQLALREFRARRLVQIPTVAEEQLLFQWYAERFVGGLELLLAHGVEPAPQDIECVEEVFEEGQRIVKQMRLV